MRRALRRKKPSAFQIIPAGFSGVILIGAILLMLPASSEAGCVTCFEEALFTSTSAVCVTGLVIRDTASYWSGFGQTVILLLIQIGGLGIVSVTAFITVFLGKKVSLLQRSLLQESLSAHQIGGVVKLTGFIFRTTFIMEFAGALMMLPSFCGEFGTEGIWMAVFHAVSAFCNAGFDIMGRHSGAFSSLTHFRDRMGVVLPVCLLITCGGIGFLTWDDIAVNRFHWRRYRMQSKAILACAAGLLVFPALFLFFNDFSGFPLKERIGLALFQSVTPRTAGFNTIDLSEMQETGLALLTFLMLIGGAPGSTAGGLKTTTAAVLLANAAAVFRRQKEPHLFGRRIEDSALKTAAALLTVYCFLVLSGAFLISSAEHLPMDVCIFEAVSAMGTVGLSLGITPSLGLCSHLVLILLMFCGRVGGLTIIYAAVSAGRGKDAVCPAEKIMVG